LQYNHKKSFVPHRSLAYKREENHYSIVCLLELGNIFLPEFRLCSFASSNACRFGVTTVAKESASSAQELASSAEELSKEVQGLNELIEQFKVE